VSNATAEKFLGVIALASPIDPIVFQRGLDFLRARGFKTKVAGDPAAAWQKSSYLFSSAPVLDRINQLYQLFEDPSVEAILLVRGGYGSLELLSGIDFARLSKNPKPFVGISDLTPFLNTLYRYTEIPAIHGAVFPNGYAKAETVDHSRDSCEALFKFLATPSERKWSGTKLLCGAGDVEGKAMGGNITMLASVAGTPWEPFYDDHILFIEEIGEKPYRLHRLLMQLKLSGVLSNVSGVVIGEMVDCAAPAGSTVTVEDVFRDIFLDFGYPVVIGAPFGHGEYNLPFRYGENVFIREDSVVLMGK